MARSEQAAIVAALQGNSAFSGCSKADLEELARHCDRTSVPARWPLIHQETPADACYVILDGEASVSVKGQQVATLSAGAVVGEAGLAGHKLRNASVTSITPLDLLHIEAADFESVINSRPAVKQALLARTAPAAEATAKA